MVLLHPSTEYDPGCPSEYFPPSESQAATVAGERDVPSPTPLNSHTTYQRPSPMALRAPTPYYPRGFNVRLQACTRAEVFVSPSIPNMTRTFLPLPPICLAACSKQSWQRRNRFFGMGEKHELVGYASFRGVYFVFMTCHFQLYSRKYAQTKRSSGFVCATHLRGSEKR
ncbi:hypothetical protein PM082_024228 [Marasmius tenuissimus]|nr:hypothetical protein PM082_024228 [Marasmius tenuissimus]